MRVSVANIALTLFFAYFWIFMIRSIGALHDDFVSQSRWQETIRIAVASAIVAVMCFFAGIAFDIAIFSVKFLATLWAALVLLTVGGRRLLEWIFNRIHLGDRNIRHVAVLGTGLNARRYGYYDPRGESG